MNSSRVIIINMWFKYSSFRLKKYYRMRKGKLKYGGFAPLHTPSAKHVDNIKSRFVRIIHT